MGVPRAHEHNEKSVDKDKPLNNITLPIAETAGTDLGQMRIALDDLKQSQTCDQLVTK